MLDLIKQEMFELEVLDNLNSFRLLDKLIFTGGTMLRLCHELDRYSIELDFWIYQQEDYKMLYDSLKNCLLRYYTLKDSANKTSPLPPLVRGNNMILFEIKSNNYPNRLKIEIRKEKKKIKFEKSIAYSRNSNKQVLLNTVSLEDMMKAKIDAFINRKEIRDVYDIEFLLKKGIKLEIDEQQKNKILKILSTLTKKDYTVKLGSILEPGIRKYYISENFKILKAYIEK